MHLRFLTAGESHGKSLSAIIEGIPAGLKLSIEDINLQLERRQKGYGRGNRMKIEHDKVEINSGVRHGFTLGSPISLTILNKDWENWKMVMSTDLVDINDEEVKKELLEKKIEHVRPGHADFSGTIKFNHKDVRNVLERSSARETASRVAIGAVCLKLLKEFEIDIFSHVTNIAATTVDIDMVPVNPDEAKLLAEESPLSCIDKSAEKIMIEKINKAKEDGDTVGGIIQVIATGVPTGLGSYVHWDKRIDGMIAQAIMSIPAIKSVEIGLGRKVADLPGSKVHDEIFPKDENNEYKRITNNSGGIEGGMTTGSPIIINAAMKPIPTLKKPLRSINILTGKEHLAHYERSDVCAVPSAAVVCESMLAYILANAFLEKFGGDSIEEIKSNYLNYKNYNDLRP